jgi:hypothetical protein
MPNTLSGGVYRARVLHSAVQADAGTASCAGVAGLAGPGVRLVAVGATANLSLGTVDTPEEASDAGHT